MNVRWIFKMTEEREAEILARCEAATEGPWSWCLGSGRNVGTAVFARVGSVQQFICDCWTDYMVDADQKNKVNRDHRADMNFIWNARTDLPDAMREIQRLRKVIDKANKEFALRNGWSMSFHDNPPREKWHKKTREGKGGWRYRVQSAPPNYIDP